MRALFIFAMLCGVVVLSFAAVFLYYGVWSAWSAGSHFNFRSLVLPTFLLLGAGACAAGVFMKPSEFKEAMKPLPEPEIQRPAWLDELADPPGARGRGDKNE